MTAAKLSQFLRAERRCASVLKKQHQGPKNGTGAKNGLAKSDPKIASVVSNDRTKIKRKNETGQ